MVVDHRYDGFPYGVFLCPATTPLVIGLRSVVDKEGRNL